MPTGADDVVLGKMEGISATTAGLFCFGWAIGSSSPIARVEIADSNGRAIPGINEIAYGGRRDDIGQLHADVPAAARSGLYFFGDRSVASTLAGMVLVFHLDSGAVLRRTWQSFKGEPAAGVPRDLNSRRWTLGHAWASAWRLLRQRKYRAVAVAVAAKFSRLPKAERDPLARVASALAAAGDGPCTLMLDHDLGGGANAYRERRIAEQVRHGGKVVMMSYHVLTARHFVEVVTSGLCRRWALEDLNCIAHLCRRGIFASIHYNTAVSLPEPVGIARLLVTLRGMAGVSLSVAMHDYFLLCPSHYLLDFSGTYCGVPALTRCADCLARHTDSYVARHASRDIVEWRRAWGAVLAVADDITCFSDASCRLVIKAYPDIDAGRIVVRPHVADYARHHTLKLPSGPLCIGVVGKIGHAKGADVVKHLADKIRARGLDVSIVVIGTMGVAADRKVVRETGPYSQGRLADIIEGSSANLFLFHSIWPETFSYVCEELMQFGVPLACFDLGAPAERVAAYHSGLVIGDADRESNLLDTLIAFHERMETARQAGGTGSGG